MYVFMQLLRSLRPMQFIKITLVCFFGFWSFGGTGLAKEPIRVAIKVVEPLVSKDGNGKPIGFSIDVVESLARKLGYPISYIWVDSVEDQLSYVEQGKADLGIAAITITSNREQQVDFSHSYFRSGLRIAIEHAGQSDAVNILRNLISFELLAFLFTLAGLVWITGNLLWLFERHSNPKEFPKTYLRGTTEAIWWSLCTLITGGCENKSAKSPAGRIIAIVWMVSGIVLVAGFTATLAARMTATDIRASISRPEDLSGRYVATIQDTEAEETLHEVRAKVLGCNNISEAIEQLKSGRAEAVVFDAPVLAYEIDKRESRDVVLIGPLFEHQDYGIVIGEGSDLTETINQSLLLMNENSELKKIHEKWFGFWE